MPSASMRNLHLDARQPGAHRRNAFQVEARQGAAIGGQFALALHHVNGDVGLAVDAGGEVLGRRCGNGGVALDDRATTPPSASMPSESGVTSSSSISSVAFDAPARMSACTAAPSATTSSGFSSVCGFLPRALRWKRSSTSWRTAGMRVEPPTSTTSSICSGVMPASVMACLQGPAVRSSTGSISSSKTSRGISRW